MRNICDEADPGEPHRLGDITGVMEQSSPVALPVQTMVQWTC
jgi:hypothetical protein